MRVNRWLGTWKSGFIANRDRLGLCLCMENFKWMEKGCGDI